MVSPDLPPTYGWHTFISWGVFPSLMVLSERYLSAKSPYWLITTVTGSILLHILTWVDLNIRAERQTQ